MAPQIDMSSEIPPVDLGPVAALDLVPPPLRREIPGDLRIGLVGAGRIVHSGVMPAYRAAGLQPVAACDPDPVAAKAIRDTWGVEHTFDDYRSMINTVDLDLLDINIRWDVGLSPLRVEVVAEAARRGIHVIIAKPVAETWQQCQDMVGHAREGGITFGVDFNTRYAPAFYGCRALILAGSLGPLISAGINYHSGIGRQHTNAFDAVHDVCIHAVDVLQSWFGEAPEEVYGNWSRRVDGVGSVLSGVFSFAERRQRHDPVRLRHPPPAPLRDVRRRRAGRGRRHPGPGTARPCPAGPRGAAVRAARAEGLGAGTAACSTRCRRIRIWPRAPTCCSASPPAASPGRAALTSCAA